MPVKCETKLENISKNGPDAEDISPKVFSMGDIIWSKMGKRPFWPCIVTPDPSDGTYIKLVKKNSKELPIYHVQYFNGLRSEHSWTLPGNVLKFRGETAFVIRALHILEENYYLGNKKFAKELARYKIPPSTRRNWHFSNHLADMAQKIVDPIERLETCVIAKLQY